MIDTNSTDFINALSKVAKFPAVYLTEWARNEANEHDLHKFGDWSIDKSDYVLVLGEICSMENGFEGHKRYLLFNPLTREFLPGYYSPDCFSFEQPEDSSPPDIDIKSSSKRFSFINWLFRRK